MSGRDLEVPSLDICCSEPIEHKFGDVAACQPLNSLTRSHATHLCVFKWGQEPGKDGVWPRDIVVGHDDNGCLDFGDGLANLHPLVCNRYMEDPDVRNFERLGEFRKLLVFIRSGN